MAETQLSPQTINVNQSDEKNFSQMVYEWVAKYTDGTELKQYDKENKKLFHFGYIDQDKLTELVLNHKKTNQSFSVNVKTGLFSINGEVVKKVGKESLGLDLTDKTYQIKPILFRRVKRLFNTAMFVKATTMTYFLGWEGVVEDKKEKHGLQIFEDGTYALPPKDNFVAL